MLCVGTRLTDFATGSQSIFQNPDVRFVSLNVAGRDAHKQGALPVVRRRTQALRGAARGAAAGRGPARPWRYAREIAARRRALAAAGSRTSWRPRAGEPMSQGELIGALNESARPGDTIIAAAGGPPGDLMKLWDATGGRHCHLEFGFSCMGYELPATLGVRLAQPTRRGDRADRRRHVPDEPHGAGRRPCRRA